MKRKPNNGNSLTIVSTRNFYARQKAESENVTLNCDRPLDAKTYRYFTTVFDFSKYDVKDIERYQSLYFDNLRKNGSKNERKELELICRVLLTQIQAD